MEMFQLVFFLVFCIVPTSSLLNQVVSTGHNDQMIKELVANLSQLRHDVEVLTISGQELNKTIKTQQQIIHNQENEMKVLRQSVETVKNICKTTKDIESKHIDRIGILEDRFNQTLGAYEVIIHDVIDKLNTQEHMNEGRKTNVSGQIRYLALSFLDIRKRFDIFNTSEEEVAKRSENHLKDLSNQMTSLNQLLQGALELIAFTVARSSHGPLGGQKVIYDKVMTNVGDAYSTESGEFTCPRNGVYVFTWSTMSKSSNENCYTCIYRNGVQLLMTHSTEGNGGWYEVASNTAVLSLTVGDRIWIKATPCYFFYGYPYTAFSGWKL